MFKQLLVAFLVLLPFVCSQGKFYRLKNLATEKCLDSNNGKAVYTLPCNGGNYQSWERVGKTFKDVSTGFCLDSSAQEAVYTLECNEGNYQNWELRTDENTNSHILTNVATGFVLDSNIDGKVYTGMVNNGSYQKWQMEEISIAH